jgi:histidyl-tRNA synthetase
MHLYPWPPGILSALAVKTLDELQQLLGADASEALADLQQLWALAEGYGYADWLVFDASVVRGLAYYTGGGLGVFVVSAGCVLGGSGWGA